MLCSPEDGSTAKYRNVVDLKYTVDGGQCPAQFWYTELKLWHKALENIKVIFAAALSWKEHPIWY
jgi:hypothetical protein